MKLIYLVQRRHITDCHHLPRGILCAAYTYRIRSRFPMERRRRRISTTLNKFSTRRSLNSRAVRIVRWIPRRVTLRQPPIGGRIISARWRFVFDIYAR